MNLIRHIPNTLTLINLFCGTLGIIALDNGLVVTALILMGACLLADILDGAVARKLKITGGIGVELDSLADVVSFGALPAMMIFYMGSRYGGGEPSQQVVAVLGALNAASAGLRLARFNVDLRAREYFWGLATPAGAMIIGGWLWAQHIDRDYGFGVADKPWLIFIIPIFIIAAYHIPIKLPGLKSPRGGLFIAMSIAALVVVGLFIAGPISIPAGLILYYLAGLLNHSGKWY